jgi:hypothetical protein
MTEPPKRTLDPILWLIPFGYGALLFVAGVFWLVGGAPFDRQAYERIAGMPWPELQTRLGLAGSAVANALVRLLGGNGALLGGGLAMAVAYFGYRTGLRWAWFALWLLPMHALVDLYVLASAGGLGLAGAVWDAVSAFAIGVSLLVALPRLPAPPTEGRNPDTAD